MSAASIWARSFACRRRGQVPARIFFNSSDEVGYTGAGKPGKQEPDHFCTQIMALTQKLLLRQSQALVMTPQLMQAIKLLQLSHLDLATYVEGELERNPLLERPAEEEPVRDDGEQGEVSASSGDEDAGGDWMEDRLESRQSI